MATVTLTKVSEFNAGSLARGTDVLTNDQTLANFLNAQNLDQNNINPAMTPTWTGLTKYRNDIQLESGYDLKLYSDTGTTIKGAWDSSTGNFGVAATAKIYLDGGALSGNTYITEGAADKIDIYAGASGLMMRFDGVNTYMGVRSTNRFYVDMDAAGAFGDTYFYEEAANDIGFYCGGASSLKVSSTRMYPRGDVWLDATKKLYLDGGSNTYLYETSADVIDIVAGGTVSMRADATGVLLPSTTAPTANYATRQSVVKGYIWFTNGGVSNTSYNCTSITKNGTGDYTVTWATDFAAANYIALATAAAIVWFACVPTSLTAGTTDVWVRDDAGAAANGGAHVLVIGNQ